MNNYREVDLLPVKGVGASGTETIDIAIDEALTALYVYFRSTNLAAISEDVPPERCIDKIEIVDGGKVYWSTTGSQAAAVATYESGQWPCSWYLEWASATQNINIPLLFGRYLGDEEFAFSPNRLLNPQLKVTWTRNAKHTTTGYQLGVRVKAMQGVSPPAKALMTQNIRTYTAAIAGIEPTDLPVDLDYRRLFVHAYASESYMEGVVTHFKLDCDVGKLIVFDLTAAQLLQTIKETFPQVTLSQSMNVDDGQLHDTFLGIMQNGVLTCSGPDIFAYAYARGDGTATIWCTTHAGNPQLQHDVNGLFVGYCPHALMAYQFGRAQDPASWFKANRFGQVRFNMTGGTAGGSTSILLQRPTTLP